MNRLIFRLRLIIDDQGGLRSVVRKSLSKPGVTIRAALRIFQSNWVKLLFGKREVWGNYVQELVDEGFLDDRLAVLGERFLKLKTNKVRGLNVTPGGMRKLHAELIYTMVRDRKPSVVVETGVCNGLSSAVILQTMAKNGHGHLVSIDLPEFSDEELNQNEFWEGKGGAVVPASEQPGWLVPKTLRDRWRLELGRSQDLLQPILDKEEPVDMFIHDSEHSFENQLFEFSHGFEALKKGGVLVATDINWSDAFDVFWKTIRKQGAKCAFVDPSCAIVVKTR